MSIIQRIHEIRGMRVMFDFDLAEIYQVPTALLPSASADGLLENSQQLALAKKFSHHISSILG